MPTFVEKQPHTRLLQQAYPSRKRKRTSKVGCPPVFLHSFCKPAKRLQKEKEPQRNERTAAFAKKPPQAICSLRRRWSGQRGSNSLPPPWQGGALPDELCPRNKGYFSKGMSPCQVFVSTFSIFSSAGSWLSTSGVSGWGSTSAPSSTNSISPTGPSAG